ncbi:beta-glucosidase [Leptolyngbya sp. FACHB-261]|nr:beta-glucosidase [Leptolyngbya sp. FACHB-261]
MPTLLPTLKSLSLAEQVAQMVVVRASGHLLDHQREYPQWEATAAELQDWLGRWAVGGVIFVGGSAAELSLRCQQLQTWARLPLLLCADVEEGVGQRFAGATTLPPPLALADLAQGEDYARAMGRITAQEAYGLGLNWLLAPVVDVNSNPTNPVINVRAFGEAPDQVSRLSTAFIEGVQSATETPMLTTAKHFPGHGDTATDSHLDLPVLAHSRERLAQVELPPFAAAIAAGVDAVMSAHLNIPALDPSLPATLAPSILDGLLRQELGFEGLIVTDALMMGAITRHFDPGEAAVKAVRAGADILLMPPDPLLAIQAVVQAVETGLLSPERIQASVERIWRAKAKVASASVGSDLRWSVFSDCIKSLAAQELNRTITQQSLRLTHAEALPLAEPTPAPGWNLVLVDDISQAGDRLSPLAPAVQLPEARGWRTVLLDERNLPLLQLPTGSEPVLVQLFIRGNPFRGSAALAQGAQTLLRSVLSSGRLRAVVLYGSPYIQSLLDADLPAEVPMLFVYDQHSIAQAVVLEQLFGL